MENPSLKAGAALGAAGMPRGMFGREPPRLYRMTTENVAGYLDALEPRGARCLSVAASGDHAVNLLAAGAAEVATFDREPLAGNVQDLKLASVLGLELDEFLRFWGRTLAGDMDPGTLEARIRPHLGYGRDGWARLAGGREAEFHGYASDPAWNPYLGDAAAYGRAREGILRAGTRRTGSADVSGRFVRCDVRDIPHAGFGSGFDVIVLSNIPEAMVAEAADAALAFSRATGRYPPGAAYPATPLAEIARGTVLPLARGLNPGGRMMAGYFYRCGADPGGLEEAFSAEGHSVRLVPCSPVCGGAVPDVAVILTRDKPTPSVHPPGGGPRYC